MKKLLLFILLVLLPATGFCWPFSKPKPTPSPTPTIVKVEEPVTPAKGKGLLDQLKSELLAAKEQNKNLQESLKKGQEQLTIANSKVTELQKGIDDLTEWGVVQQAEKHKYIAKYESTVKKYHRLKAIAALIAAAVGVLLGLQFMNLAPPPYNLGVPVGAAALFAALVWFFL